MEEFSVTIDKFEGPLDLMLHLIKEKELDLFDLDVSVLTDQYIAYLGRMEEMHLEIASEYLVELADLIEYKSKKLLPKDDSELNDGYEEDPRERLIRRVLGYQQFKEVSADFDDMYRKRQEHLTRPQAEEAEQWINAVPDARYEGNPNDLLKAMKKCLMRMRLSRPIETKYTAREISMEERELQVRAMLDRLPSTFRFEALLEDCHDLPMFIATFLSVLDLARLHVLTFTVDEDDAIWFSRGVMN